MQESQENEETKVPEEEKPREFSEEEMPGDVAEHPGSTNVSPKHADELADEWGKESFPSSDPPAHY